LEGKTDMAELKDQKCEACRVGAPQVTDEEMQSLLARVPEWEVTEVDNIKRLVRTFAFPNFKEALAFTVKVGEAAEAEGHHPAILTEWGKVTVSWWTHKIEGLHVNDFVMAAKTDDVAG
jgi:4a-hydroxytetrahydrobiopterin dehydratase